MLPIHKIPFSFNECNNSQHVAKSFHFRLTKAAAQKLMDYRNRNNVQNIFHSAAKYCLDFYCPTTVYYRVDSGPSNFIQQNHKFGEKNLNLLISVYKN